jgi:hypothetical protein
MAEPETVPAVYRQLHELGLRLHAAAKESGRPRGRDRSRSSVITSIGTGIFSLGCGGTLTRLREFSETGKWSGLLHLVIELVGIGACTGCRPNAGRHPKMKLFYKPLGRTTPGVCTELIGVGGDGCGRN